MLFNLKIILYYLFLCTTHIEYVRGDTIRMDTNVTDTVLGANSALALANFFSNDSSVAFKQRDIFVEVKLM